MNQTVQAKKAALLKKLHHGPNILILANVWDAISARIVEEIGYPAVATTSAGVAATLGYPDGQRVSREEMLEAVARVARAVEVPVTADMEAGYGTSPEEMADTARAVIEAGAVGLNLEDITGDDGSSQVALELQIEKILAIREASASAGVPLVINARTDVYLMPIGPPETRFGRSRGSERTPRLARTAFSHRRSRTRRRFESW
jgi:2-methylisocitrate lyase-like PEP mutase family enzyme